MTLPRCTLAGRGRVILNSLHGALTFLTALFLLLEGVSGPGTGYWWLRVTYGAFNRGISQGRQGGNQKEGDVWLLGALGACQEGARCPSQVHPPPGYIPAQGALVYHLAAAILFLLVAITNLFLILYPPSSKTAYRRSTWWTLGLPLLAYLPVFMAFVATLAVRQNIKSEPLVSQVETLPSFWLSTLALTTSTIWVLLIEWVRYLYIQQKKERSREAKRRKGKHDMQQRSQAGRWAWLSPFGRTERAT